MPERRPRAATPGRSDLVKLHPESSIQPAGRERSRWATPRRRGHLSRCDAVLFDNIGYAQHSRDEIEVLFTFLAERYEGAP